MKSILKKKCSNLIIARLYHAESIFTLLNEYFDPIAEQLPDIDEIYEWIEEEHIIISETNGKIQGFIIYDLIGLTSYLRYWFVDPLYRNMKIGSSLLNKYFENSKNTKRQLFWVIQSNENAIMRYKHYGFKPENLIDVIMINREVSYETKSN